MRKFLFLSFLFSLSLTFAQGQNSFSVFHFKAKKGGEDALVALFEKNGAMPNSNLEVLALSALKLEIIRGRIEFLFSVKSETEEE